MWLFGSIYTFAVDYSLVIHYSTVHSLSFYRIMGLFDSLRNLHWNGSTAISALSSEFNRIPFG